MRRKLNLKFLVGLLLAALVVSIGLLFLYRFQLNRHAASLLTRADRAEELGDTTRLMQLLERYLDLQPQDDRALERYSLLLARVADSSHTRERAAAALSRLVRRHPERNDLRKLRVRLRRELGQLANVKEDLTSLLKAFPDDGELEDWLGQCEQADDNPKAAAGWYTRAIQHAPTRLECFVRLAGVMRTKLDQAKEADQVMEDLITANVKSAQAYLFRARYRQEFHSLAEAAKDLVQARSLAPDQADVLLASALVARAAGDVESARRHLNRGRELHPTSAIFYTTMAAVEQQAGHHAEAVACLRRGLPVVAATQRSAMQLALLEILIQGDDLNEAEEVLGWFHQAEASPLIQFHRARLLMQRGQWSSAAAILQAVRPVLLRSPGLGVSVHLLLAECHEKLGDPEQQLEMQKKAVDLHPNSAPARLALGSTLLARGDGAGGAAAFRQMMALPGAAANGWALLARALFVQNMGLAADRRDWKETTEALERAVKAEPNSTEAVILQAETLAAQGKPEQGQQLLEAARERQPKEAALWVALAAWSERQGKPVTADTLLTEGEQKLGAKVEFTLARIGFTVHRGGEKASSTLEHLEKELDKSHVADRKRLIAALGDSQLRLGQVEAAERLWARAAEMQPHDLGIRLLLLDLALIARKDDRVRPLLDDLKRIEGEEGTWWRCGEAALLINQAARGNRDGLDRAVTRLEEIAKRRPKWGRVAVLEAQVCELTGRPDDALAKYQQAVERGERQPLVIQRLVHLLYDRHRYREADQVIRKLQDGNSLPTDLKQLAPELALHSLDVERALSLAQQAVSAQPNESRNYLWLGLSQWGLGKRAEAEASLRKAHELGPDVPATWVALIQFLAGTDQKARAEELLQVAEKKLPAREAALSLAQCCEAVSQLEQATKHYETALTARPDDIAVLRAVASFCMRSGQLLKAEAPLRKIISQGANEAEWARRTLAVVLAQSGAIRPGGDYRRFREALELLDHNRSAYQTESNEDQYARAQVLATRSAFHRQAVALLGGLAANRQLPAEDEFLLGQLHEGLGNWKEADLWMASYLSSHNTSRIHLAHYARSKLRRKDVRAAQPRLDVLERLYPDSWETTEIKVRVLQAEDKGTEAVAVLKKFLEARAGTKADVEPMGMAASLLEELGHPAEAEAAFRDYIARSERPESVLTLVAFYGRQKRVNDALDLCDQAWRKCSPAAAASASLAVLRAATVSAEQIKRVEARLEPAIEKKSEPALLMALASLRDIQGRYDDSTALHRRVLDTDPDNVAALNNLAWVLALRGGKASEALSLINRAIELFGPEARLLDTRAVVHLVAGENADAIADLAKALDQKEAALYSFHLALAHHRTGMDEKARSALRVAQAAGLTVDMLHPLERTAFRQLCADLQMK
jgi:predicted Zn-dependent protease